MNFIVTLMEVDNIKRIKIVSFNRKSHVIFCPIKLKEVMNNAQLDIFTIRTMKSFLFLCNIFCDALVFFRTVHAS